MIVAHTALGDLRGAEDGGAVVFRAVPYAAPPVGALRFMPPQPVAASDGLRDATRHGPIAPQAPSRLRLAMGDFSCPQDEDCLTLTIWTPAADAAARPVMVWLHGGAWISGAGSLDWYNGARLAQEGDIVVVGVNYRLGALGYLQHPAIGPGNCGTLDQVAALAWVHEHIRDFGGDPARITVAGQSAGAATIGYLLTMPEARGLIRRVVLQSGGFGRGPGAPDRAIVRAEQYLRLLEIDPDAADARERLGAVPAARLIEAQTAFARANARFGDTAPPFGPVAAARITAAELVAAIGKAAAGLDVLIGTTREEGHAFFAPDAVPDDPDALAARFKAVTGSADAVTAYRARRPGATARDLLADLTTDDVFRMPGMRLADAIAERGGPVFAYEFDWAPPESLFKACHCIELPFVFGSFDAWPDAKMLEGGDPAQMQALSALMRQAWIGFVRDGTPAHPAMPVWPEYTLPQRRVMSFGPVVGAIGDPAGLGLA
jgi:para-nitrobenzyl esterase